ncbi:MAG TPA: hypothetical protein VFA60_16005 [Terriglobales bacterium]|nr:hypothetical protein [Terriglobales bacterium]
MPLDPETAHLMARVTARLTGVTFILAMALGARARLRQESHDPAKNVFGLFTLSQTVHYATVLMLAWVTAGASIAQAGGWRLVLIIAAVSYAGMGLLWRSSGPEAVPGARRTAYVFAVLFALIYGAAFSLHRYQLDWALLALLAAALVFYARSWFAPLPEKAQRAAG